MLSRKTARESVYKLIYEYLFTKTPNAESIAWLETLNYSKGDKLYIRTAYFGVIEHFDDIIELIGQFTGKYNVDRVFKADIAALILAVYEMKYMPDIPMSVSINESVELVKRYSTEKSNQYVNGILASVFKMLTAEGAK